MYPHRYKLGKNLQPITTEQFEAALKHPYNQAVEFQAYTVEIYYTGVRVSEALRAVKEDYREDAKTLWWDVGRRLKHGKETKPLPLSLEQPHMDLLLEQVNKTKKMRRVFDFDRTTAWRHISRTGIGYNHRARLNLITLYLSRGWSVAQVVNWFGISVQTVNSYIGDTDMLEMGKMKR